MEEDVRVDGGGCGGWRRMPIECVRAGAEVNIAAMKGLRWVTAGPRDWKMRV
jgi:hypothetical protein